MEYTKHIHSSIHQSQAPQNSQEIVLDITANLRQIEAWTLKGFTQRQKSIGLFLELTRKNVKALSNRELGKKFRPMFDEFCREYEKQERVYERGITDHKGWADVMSSLAKSLDRTINLL